MAQERFFSFTEGWITYVTTEDDSTYTTVGMNFTLTPVYTKYIQFSTFDKSGNLLSEWDYRIDSTAVTTEIRNQQSFSNFEEKYIIGITTKSPPDFVLNAEYLKLNHEASQIVERSALLEDAIMYITQQLGDNKILQATDDFNGSTVNSTLLSTDTLGNIIWENNFSCGGNSCWMVPRHIHPAHDGGYIFTHTEERNSNNGWSIDDHDVANIIKTDSLGIEQWRIHPGGEGDPYSSEHILLQPTDDGNYLCVWADNFWETPGTPHFQINPDATMWLAKIAPDGNKIWEKTLQEQIDDWDIDATAYIMKQMIRTSDDNFIIAGADKLFKISQEGDIIWARHYNPLNLEFSYEQIYFYRMYGINETSDGGFIIAGEFEAREGTDFPEFVQTGFVLKVDEYGCYEADCQEDDPIVGVEEVTQAVSKLAIYPNPTNRDITIEYHLPDMPDQLRLSIHNLTGEVVHTQSLSAHAGSVRVELGEYLPAGAYFCHLAVGGEVLGVERFVLVR